MKKNQMTVTRAIEKLNRKATLAIKNGNYDDAQGIVQGLAVLADLNQHHEYNIKIRAKQTESHEIEYALVQTFKKAQGPLTFKQLTNEMKINPNSADKTRYNGAQTPRWRQRANARLRWYKDKGYATFNKTNRTWSLTSKGKRSLEQDGYF